jgi:hypothetical protein
MATTDPRPADSALDPSDIPTAGLNRSEFLGGSVRLKAIHTVHWRAHCDSPSRYAVSCTAAYKTTISVAWVVEPIAAAYERAVLWAVLRVGVAESATGAVAGLSSRRG